MQVPNVLKVIYAPHKAFKEIAERPSYMGPILVAILFVAANAGFAYVALTKTYAEQTLPSSQQLDEWTQNSTLWTSSAAVSDGTDKLNGTIYGDKSISFSADNVSLIWVQSSDLGPVNCSDGTYTKLTFRLKQTGPQDRPQSVTGFLLCGAASGNFSLDLSQNFSSVETGIWNNITLPLVEGWVSNGSGADWGNIRGIRLELSWQGNSNVSLLLDGLFFHGNFKSLWESGGTSYVMNFALSAAMQFVITWVILSGVVYLLSKAMGGKIVWRFLLMIVGSILIVMVVQALLNMIAYSTLPNVKYPFELLGGVTGEGQTALDLIVEQTAFVTLASRIIQIASYVWIIGLCAVGVRVLGNLSWMKSILAATLAYLVTIFVGGFLFG